MRVTITTGQPAGAPSHKNLKADMHARMALHAALGRSGAHMRLNKQEARRLKVFKEKQYKTSPPVVVDEDIQTTLRNAFVAYVDKNRKFGTDPRDGAEIDAGDRAKVRNAESLHDVALESTYWKSDSCTSMPMHEWLEWNRKRQHATPPSEKVVKDEIELKDMLCSLNIRSTVVDVKAFKGMLDRRLESLQRAVDEHGYYVGESHATFMRDTFNTIYAIIDPAGDITVQEVISCFTRYAPMPTTASSNRSILTVAETTAAQLFYEWTYHDFFLIGAIKTYYYLNPSSTTNARFLYAAGVKQGRGDTNPEDGPKRAPRASQTTTAQPAAAQPAAAHSADTSSLKFPNAYLYKANTTDTVVQRVAHACAGGDATGIAEAVRATFGGKSRAVIKDAVEKHGDVTLAGGDMVPDASGSLLQQTLFELRRECGENRARFSSMFQTRRDELARVASGTSSHALPRGYSKNPAANVMQHLVLNSIASQIEHNVHGSAEEREHYITSALGSSGQQKEMMDAMLRNACKLQSGLLSVDQTACTYAEFNKTVRAFHILGGIMVTNDSNLKMPISSRSAKNAPDAARVVKERMRESARKRMADDSAAALKIQKETKQRVDEAKQEAHENEKMAKENEERVKAAEKEAAAADAAGGANIPPPAAPVPPPAAPAPPPAAPVPPPAAPAPPPAAPVQPPAAPAPPPDAPAPPPDAPAPPPAAPVQPPAAKAPPHVAEESQTAEKDKLAEQYKLICDIETKIKDDKSKLFEGTISDHKSLMQGLLDSISKIKTQYEKYKSLNPSHSELSELSYKMYAQNTKICNTYIPILKRLIELWYIKTNYFPYNAAYYNASTALFKANANNNFEYAHAAAQRLIILKIRFNEVFKYQEEEETTRMMNNLIGLITTNIANAKKQKLTHEGASEAKRLLTATRLIHKQMKTRFDSMNKSDQISDWRDFITQSKETIRAVNKFYQNITRILHDGKTPIPVQMAFEDVLRALCNVLDKREYAATSVPAADIEGMVDTCFEKWKKNVETKRDKIIVSYSNNYHAISYGAQLAELQSKVKSLRDIVAQTLYNRSGVVIKAFPLILGTGNPKYSYEVFDDLKETIKKPSPRQPEKPNVVTTSSDVPTGVPGNASSTDSQPEQPDSATTAAPPLSHEEYAPAPQGEQPFVLSESSLAKFMPTNSEQGQIVGHFKKTYDEQTYDGTMRTIPANRFWYEFKEEAEGGDSKEATAIMAERLDSTRNAMQKVLDTVTNSEPVKAMLPKGISATDMLRVMHGVPVMTNVTDKMQTKAVRACGADDVKFNASDVVIETDAFADVSGRTFDRYRDMGNSKFVSHDAACVFIFRMAYISKPGINNHATPNDPDVLYRYNYKARMDDPGFTPEGNLKGTRKQWHDMKWPYESWRQLRGCIAYPAHVPNDSQSIEERRATRFALYEAYDKVIDIMIERKKSKKQDRVKNIVTETKSVTFGTNEFTITPDDDEEGHSVTRWTYDCENKIYFDDLEQFLKDNIEFNVKLKKDVWSSNYKSSGPLYMVDLAYNAVNDGKTLIIPKQLKMDRWMDLMMHRATPSDFNARFREMFRTFNGEDSFEFWKLIEQKRIIKYDTVDLRNKPNPGFEGSNIDPRYESEIIYDSKQLKVVDITLYRLLEQLFTAVPHELSETATAHLGHHLNTAKDIERRENATVALMEYIQKEKPPMPFPIYAFGKWCGRAEDEKGEKEYVPLTCLREEYYTALEPFKTHRWLLDSEHVYNKLMKENGALPLLEKLPRNNKVAAIQVWFERRVACELGWPQVRDPDNEGIGLPWMYWVTYYKPKKDEFYTFGDDKSYIEHVEYKYKTDEFRFIEDETDEDKWHKDNYYDENGNILIKKDVWGTVLPIGLYYDALATYISTVRYADIQDIYINDTLKLKMALKILTSLWWPDHEGHSGKGVDHGNVYNDLLISMFDKDYENNIECKVYPNITSNQWTKLNYESNKAKLFTGEGRGSSNNAKYAWADTFIKLAVFYVQTFIQMQLIIRALNETVGSPEAIDKLKMETRAVAHANIRAYYRSSLEHSARTLCGVVGHSAGKTPHEAAKKYMAAQIPTGIDVTDEEMGAYIRDAEATAACVPEFPSGGVNGDEKVRLATGQVVDM